jgi:hypothetical protein
MRGKELLISSAITLSVAAAFAGNPGGGRSPFLSPGAGGVNYRVCGWGDSRYDGYRVYYFDTAAGNFRVWYVLEGPNALEDRRDQNKNGVPDVAEWIGTDYEYNLALIKSKKWYFHPNPEEGRYLPTRDYYPEINWPTEEEDYGGSDRWDIYCGNLGTGVVGMVFAFGPFPASERACYSAYFNASNSYDPEVSRKIVASLWGTTIAYMFDAAETSETAIQRWLAQATHEWIVESTFPLEPNSPGKGFFTRLFNDTLSPVTENGGAFLWFMEDWSYRYWVTPEWRPLDDYPVVKYVWRATSRGDAWYTAEPGLDRGTEAAFECVIRAQNRSNAFVEGRAFQDSFEEFTAWNWFTGSRDDGRHYKNGSQFPELRPQNTWTDYPVVNYRPGSGALMNYLGAGYYRFDSPPAWGAAVVEFRGDPANKKESKDWGGRITVSRDGTTWTDLDGEAGKTSRMFSPGDKCLIQIRYPAQYKSIVAIVDCTAYAGTNLGFRYSFVPTEDLTPPRISVAAARPEANPGIVEVLLGGDEKLYGAEGDIIFIPRGESSGVRTKLEFAGTEAGYSFVGSYFIEPEAVGSGVITWRTADVAGNLVAGEKDFGAGYLASRGGAVECGRAALNVPAGALAGRTLLTIFPEDGASADASAATAPADDGLPELVGPTYDIGPAWARPRAPLRVTLSYEGLAAEREDYLSIYIRDGAGWRDLGGEVDRRGRRVTARTDRLGSFTLGYGEKKGSRPPSGTPLSFALYQNYPNPARGETSIAYTLPARAELELAVYDLSGRRVATLVDDVRGPGAHEERYDLTDDAGRHLPAGVYVYRLRTGAEAASRKMVITR